MWKMKNKKSLKILKSKKKNCKKKNEKWKNKNEKYHYGGNFFFLWGKKTQTVIKTCGYIFSRGPATLHLAVSVGPSVRRSVRRSHFWIASGFRITAPTQPSATGLPCIRPCFFHLRVTKKVKILKVTDRWKYDRQTEMWPTDWPSDLFCD